MRWAGRSLSVCPSLAALCPGRFVIQLLEDLVFFVSDVANNGQNVLDIVVTKPNRERQKLMREQNILKQVSGSVLLHLSQAEVLWLCPAVPRAMLEGRDLEKLWLGCSSPLEPHQAPLASVG